MLGVKMCQVVRDRDAGVDWNELEQLNHGEMIRKIADSSGTDKTNLRSSF